MAIPSSYWCLTYASWTQPHAFFQDSGSVWSPVQHYSISWELDRNAVSVFSSGLMNQKLWRQVPTIYFNKPLWWFWCMLTFDNLCSGVCSCHLTGINIFFKFYFYFILLYNTVLVLPYIDMNLPRVYTSSQSCIPLPPPTPYHLSGSSPCTSPRLVMSMYGKTNTVL